MQFRTTVHINPSPYSVNLKHHIYTIGSCFADAIGSRLENYKFDTLANPFGVVYNPHSLHKLLEYAIQNKKPDADTFLQQSDVHLNYDFHSELSALNKAELETHIQARIFQSHEFLSKADWLLITYGTAWVYARKDNGKVVANCHKLPADNFEKILLSQKRIIESFQQLFEKLKKLNPKIKIILTVSPVRHMKDTFQLNNVSKSVLLLSCHTLSQLYDDVQYFPAYEIMMDELRDYRFYKPDMLHPSEEAENFIWEKFIETYAGEKTKAFITKWKGILASLQHKAFHRTSSAHQQFLKKTLEILEELKYEVNVDKEISIIKSQLLS